MKKLFIVVFVLIISTGLLFGAGKSEDSKAGAEGGAKTYELRLSSEYSEDNHQTIALRDAAKKIEELTGGNVKITVYPNTQLGDYTVVYGQVMSGDIDMCACPIASSFDRRIDVLTLPYLATDFLEFKDLFFPGSYIWEVTSDITASTDTTLLGMFNAGFMGLGSVSFPNEDFDNLTDGLIKKKTLLRTPPSKVYVKTVEAMGYRTTTIPWADLFSALQTGVADGWIGGSALVNYENFRDVINYFVDTRIINECIPVVINSELLKSMPEEYQKAITETFLEMSERVADERKKQEQEAAEMMTKYGIKVIEPTDAEIASLRDYIRKTVWNDMRKDIGDDVVDNLCDSYGVPKM